MVKRISSRTHVFAAAFDQLCISFGPRPASDKSVAAIVCRDVRSIRDWRSGLKACPRWAYELVRLTLDERRRVLEEMTGRYKAIRFHSTRLTDACLAFYGSAAANDSASIVDLPSAHQEM